MDFPVTEQFVQTANAVQLHTECRQTNEAWPASFCFVDGAWVYRVDEEQTWVATDDPRVKLGPFTPTIDAAHVQAAIAAHVPA